MDEEQKKKRIATIVKWSGGLLAVALLSPVTFLVLKGLLGIYAVVATVGVGAVGLKLTPYFSLKTSNLMIKLISNEARKNPIETMKTLQIEKTKQLAEAEDAIVSFETEVANFDDQVNEFQRRFPAEAESFAAISRKMHEALQLQKDEQDNARKLLADFECRIEKAEAIYAMSLAAQRVTRLSQDAETAVFDEIRTKVAFNSVRTELNRSFAQLNSALEQRKSLPSIPTTVKVMTT